MSTVTISAPRERTFGRWFNARFLREFAVRVWREMDQDRVTGQAAELAFFFLLAVFPFLLFLTAVLGWILQSEVTLYDAIRTYLVRLAPASITELIDSTLREVTNRAGGGKAVFGLLTAFWAASSGMVAMIEGLNIAYEVTERRPWWRKRLVAAALTATVITMMVLALALLSFGARVKEWIADRYDLGGWFNAGASAVNWLLLLGLVVVAFNILYIYAPNAKHRKWNWLLPGTVVGIGLWLLASLGLKLYLTYFDNYSVTYGSIGAVVILLLWFYVSAIAILIGAEVNSEVQKERGVRSEVRAHSEDGRNRDPASS